MYLAFASLTLFHSDNELEDYFGEIDYLNKYGGNGRCITKGKRSNVFIESWRN